MIHKVINVFNKTNLSAETISCACNEIVVVLTLLNNTDDWDELKEVARINFCNPNSFLVNTRIEMADDRVSLYQYDGNELIRWTNHYAK